MDENRKIIEVLASTALPLAQAVSVLFSSFDQSSIAKKTENHASFLSGKSASMVIILVCNNLASLISGRHQVLFLEPDGRADL